MREELGPGRLMMDANQCWDVDEAITQMKALAQFDPWWIEEPTSPDDVLGHARIARAIAPIADHLREHFVDPCVTERVRYQAPLRPGYSIAIRPESIAEYEDPHGAVRVRHAD
jgi:L-alanine-DL-glutamate epimerase-like enolase superfamily enzyme